MGGNVTATNRITGKELNPDKIPIRDITRDEFKIQVLKLFKFINSAYAKKFGSKLWKNEANLESGYLFNGSSSFIMSPDYTSEEIHEFKPFAGDMDVIVPKEAKENVFDLLDDFENSEILEGIFYAGSNKPSKTSIGDQINCVFIIDFEIGKIKCQVDFEFLDVDQSGDDDIVAPFSKFGHSSSFEDLKVQIKGLFQKYIIRALVYGTSVRSDIVVVTPASTVEKYKIKSFKENELPRMMRFSVDRGLGDSYEKMYIGDKPFKLNGKSVYRELKPQERTYQTDIKTIFSFIFNIENPSSTQLKQFESFVGIVELMKDLDKSHIKSTIERFLELLWASKGERGQEVELFDSAKDLEIKSIAWNYISKELNIKINIDKMLEEYYDSYKGSTKASEKPKTFKELLKIKD